MWGKLLKALWAKRKVMQTFTLLNRPTRFRANLINYQRPKLFNKNKRKFKMIVHCAYDELVSLDDLKENMKILANNGRVQRWK